MAGVCDFCGEPDPVTMYEASPIMGVHLNEAGSPSLIEQLDKDWAACAGCSNFIVARDQPGLTAYALTKHGIPVDEPEAQKAIGGLHKTFMDGLQPGSRPITAEENAEDVGLEVGKLNLNACEREALIAFAHKHGREG